MRRVEREIRDIREIENILHKALVCRVAFAHDGRPYIVPVNFGYRNRCLYFHCAPAGKKLDIIKKNNNVCFEAEADLELITGDDPCKEWTMKYRSVIGSGKAHIVEDPNEKIKGLNTIMAHYSGQDSHEYDDKTFRKVTVVKIEIETMTGKKSV